MKNTKSCAKSLRWILVAAVLTSPSLFVGQVLAAAFKEKPGSVDTAFFFKRTWLWDFTLAQWPPPEPTPPLHFWNVSLKSTGFDFLPSLNVTAKHLISPEPGPDDKHFGDLNPNPNDGNHTFKNLSRPLENAEASSDLRTLQVTHPNIPHDDVFKFKLTLNPEGEAPPAKVEVSGVHSGKKDIVLNWSYHHRPTKPDDPQTGKISVFAAYRDGSVDQIKTKLPVGGQDPVDLGGEIPKKDVDTVAYEVIFDKDPITRTTLGFVGDVDSQAFSLLDVGLATKAFVGSTEFLVPQLFSPSTDLYVFVDLTQWLGFPIPSLSDESFSFTSGKNDLLRGVLATTSPSTFIPGQGLIFDPSSLYNGVGERVGFIDGRVPEPSTLGLLGIGFALLVIYKRLVAIRRSSPRRLVGVSNRAFR